MKPNPLHLLLFFICFCIGLITFLIYHKYIIFNFSFSRKAYTNEYTILKKNQLPITLHYWVNDSWRTEKNTILSCDDTADSIRQLVRQLLDVFEQENILEKQISLEHVVMTANGQAIISFDRNPLNKKSNTFEKLMFIESILRTIRENNIKVSEFFFLSHYKPINDPELDFSNPWPIYGFLTA